MIQIGGLNYYIDLEAINNFVTENPDTVNKDVESSEVNIFYSEDGEEVSRQKSIRLLTRGRDINQVLYDNIVNMIVTITENNEDTDEKLGSNTQLAKQSIGFKIAFNTLRFYKILKEI